MIESLFDTLAGLPPAGIYLAIAVLAALENIFPPVPADTAAALGGFLAARNPAIDVYAVFVVTVAANIASAVGVFYLSRRVGGAFRATRLGRLLLSERVVAAVQREYERHQVLGIFVSRCLPVYRAVVPPFAGMAGVPARRAIAAIALASSLFYGLVIWLAYTLGSNWDAVRRTIAGLGTGLMGAAAVLTVIVVILVVRGRRSAGTPPA